MSLLCLPGLAGKLRGQALYEVSTNGSSAEVLIKRAKSELLSNDWTAAAAFFDQATQADSNNAAAFSGEGRCLLELHRFPEAVAAYQRAVTLQPTRQIAWYGLGVTYFELRQYPAATTAFQRVLKLNPKNADAISGLYETLLREKKLGAAVNVMRQATRIFPTNAFYYARLGWCLDQLDQEEDAIQALRQSINLDPKYADGWLWLGICYYDQDTYTLSVSSLRQCLALEPGNFDGRYWLGMDYYELKEDASATEWLQKAADLRPRSFRVNFWRGMSLLRAGKYSEAATNLEVAHAVRPTDKGTKSSLFICRVILAQYWQAYQVFPGMFYFGGGAILVAYIALATVLLRRSLRVSPDMLSPGIVFSLGWVVLLIEGELAFVLVLAALSLVHINETPLTAVILAAIPIIYATVKGFSRQPWGGPFATTLRPIPAKILGFAVLTLIFLLLVDEGYTEFMKLLTHRAPPAQETVPFIQFAWHTNPVTALLAIVMVAPVTEEIIFRGLVFGAMEKPLGKWGAILVSAVVFTLAHFQMAYFVPIFASGVALGWLRARAGSLGPSMLVHCLNNGISLAAIMLGNGS